MKLTRVMALAFCIVHPSAWAMNCAEYNAIGPDIQNEYELATHPISKSQIEAVRKNTALKAGRVAVLTGTPMSTKLQNIMKNEDQVAEMVSGISTLVRYDCYRSPSKQFYTAVSDQFEVVVDHITEKYN